MRHAAAAIVLFFAVSASATEPSPADRESARAYMTEGRQKRDASDFKAALRAFQAADAIMHVPTTAFEVAKTESMMNMLVEARDEALRIARIPQAPGEPAPFAEARAAAQKLADDLESRVPSIRVTLKSGPESATVTIDDVVLPAIAVGLPRKLDPGTHVIVAKAGAIERRVSVQVLEREAKEVPIDLAEVAVKPAVVTPVITTTTTTSTTSSDARPSRSGPWMTVGIATLAAGVIGIGVGSVTGVMSLSETSTIKNQCNGNACPSSQTNALSDARTLAMISDIGFIAGGVLAALGVTFIVIGATKIVHGERGRGPGEHVRDGHVLIYGSFAGA